MPRLRATAARGKRRCSSGASATGGRAGSSSANTCSMLCVTPGAKRWRHCAIDLEGVDDVPALEPPGWRFDAGLLPHFACRRAARAARPGLERSGDRLPVAGTQRAFEQQHFQLRGVHHHQHRKRQLVLMLAVKVGQWQLRSPDRRTRAKKGLPRSAQYSALERSTSTRMPRSSSARVAAKDQHVARRPRPPGQIAQAVLQRVPVARRTSRGSRARCAMSCSSIARLRVDARRRPVCCRASRPRCRRPRARGRRRSAPGPQSLEQLAH